LLQLDTDFFFSPTHKHSIKSVTFFDQTSCLPFRTYAVSDVLCCLGATTIYYLLIVSSLPELFD
jgi:hypothetical protein